MARLDVDLWLDDQDADSRLPLVEWTEARSFAWVTFACGSGSSVDINVAPAVAARLAAEMEGVAGEMREWAKSKDRAAGPVEAER